MTSRGAIPPSSAAVPLPPASPESLWPPSPPSNEPLLRLAATPSTVVDVVDSASVPALASLPLRTTIFFHETRRERGELDKRAGDTGGAAGERGCSTVAAAARVAAAAEGSAGAAGNIALSSNANDSGPVPETTALLFPLRSKEGTTHEAHGCNAGKR